MHTSPTRILGKKVAELHALARFGHHWRDRVAPDGIMLGFLMCRCGVGISINLDQHETRRVVLLLDDIEARDAWFFQARTRVGERGLIEGVNALRFDMNMNMNN